MNVPRGHHYVPQMLLAGFTESGLDSGRLHIVDIVRRTAYTSTPRGTAKEKDFNLVQVDGVDPFVVESTLFAEQIEGPAAAVFCRARQGHVPETEEEQQSALAFVAMQALRVPNRRDMTDEFMRDLTKLLVRAVTESEAAFEAEKQRHPDELSSVTKEELREWGESITDVRHTPTTHLGMLLPGFEVLLDLLGRRSWVVLEADGADFVCCDDPVVLMPSGSRPPNEPRGFGSRDAQVYMPIGRRHALLGFWPEEDAPPVWGLEGSDARTVALMNTQLILYAARKFVASPKSDFTWIRKGRVVNREAFMDMVRNRPG